VSESWAYHESTAVWTTGGTTWKHSIVVAVADSMVVVAAVAFVNVNLIVLATITVVSRKIWKVIILISQKITFAVVTVHNNSGMYVNNNKKRFLV